MASTVKLASELAAWTAHAVTRDTESWKQYLTMASWLYKCEEIRRIAGLCYTGAGFMECCGGDKELALALFDYCDWQHPSSALPEITSNGEEQEESQKKGQSRILQTLPCEYEIGA